jgi:hypothetical protein
MEYLRGGGGGTLILCVCVFVCARINCVTQVSFERCFEKMCKASFLRGAFLNVRRPYKIVVRVVRFLLNLGTSTDLVKLPNIRFNKKNTCNSSRFKSRTHTYGRTDGHGNLCVCGGGGGEFHEK